MQVEQHYTTVLHEIEHLLYGRDGRDALEERMRAMIQSHDFRNAVDPKVAGDVEAETYLHAFVALQEKAEALRRFAIVNQTAVTKILKKYVKWVALPIFLGVLPRDPVTPHPADEHRRPTPVSFDFAADDDAEDDAELAAIVAENARSAGDECSSDKEHDSNHDGASMHAGNAERDTEASYELACMQPTAVERWQRLQHRLLQLQELIMLSSSSCHDYVCSVRTQHSARRELHKAGLRESRHLAATSNRVRTFASVLNFQQTWQPTTLLWMLILVPVSTFALTYGITSQLTMEVNGVVEPVFKSQGYFISASIDRTPASHVGTLGISVASLFLVMVILVRHKLIKRQLLGRATFIHRSSMVLGMASAFAMLGVAAFQRHLHGPGHNTFAVAFFVLAVLHTIMECALEYRYQLSKPWVMLGRIGTVIVTVVFVVIFLSFLYLGARRAVRLTGKRDMNVLFVAAMAEIGAFFLLLYYFYSYLDDFAATRVHMVILEQQSSLVHAYPSLEEFIEKQQQQRESKTRVKKELYERRKEHMELVAKDFSSAIDRVRMLLYLRRRSREKGLTQVDTTTAQAAEPASSKAKQA
eukprot:TRINITY_DN10031_c0_g1_i1.p1 TRINITY_DN10031_c0_g1~~TRINITY_DN10031_c0_g1_i1.p1  ORF type:complete len:644 (+),score=167.10 TRINITY_DN10031_c0_g1_i1:180-1934(+)